MIFKKNNSKHNFSIKSKDVKKLKKRIQELEYSRDNWKNKYKKTKEDYINFKKKL